MSFVLDAGALTKTGLFHTLNILKAVKRLLIIIFNSLLDEFDQIDNPLVGSNLECVGFIIFTVSNNEYFNDGMLIGLCTFTRIKMT